MVLALRSLHVRATVVISDGQLPRTLAFLPGITSVADAGSDPAGITDSLFNLKPVSTVCLWEHALRGVNWTGAPIWTEITKKTLTACGAEPSEAEGIVNFLTGTEGSRAGAILHET